MSIEDKILTELTSSISKRIEADNMSIERWAVLNGLTSSTLHNLFSGRRGVGIQTLQTLAKSDTSDKDWLSTLASYALGIRVKIDVVCENGDGHESTN